MKQILHTTSILLFILASLFVSPSIALADEGDEAHQLVMEVNGYHITLESQNEWAKGENTIVVMLTDSMGMPISDADMEILIAQKSNEHVETESDGHGNPESGGHTEVDVDTHGAEQQHDSMSGMDMVEAEQETTEMSAHDEEVIAPMEMTESDEHGVYIVETHLESAGEHEVHIMFHVNGEMLQADFVVVVPGTSSKTIVLWSFAMINVALITSAGILKKQTIPVKGGK